MENYKLSQEANQDLIRIHKYGVENYGEKKADEYFYDFFDHFKRITDNPYQFPSAENIRKGYRICVCGVDAIYYKINKNIIEIIAIIGSIL
jgi:toxin ParE1/3/4